MNKIIDAISDAARKLIAIQNELKELDRREADASKEAQSLADQPFDKAISSIRGQRTTADYIVARRANLQGKLPESVARLRKAIKDCDDHWTAIVRAHREQIERKFYSVNAEFFGGSIRETQRNLNHESLPAWNNANSGNFYPVPRWDAPETIIETAGAIIVHIDKHLSNFNVAILD